MSLVSEQFYQCRDRGNGGSPAAYPVIDGVTLYAGWLCGLDQSDGYLKPWTTATGADLDFKGICTRTTLGDATPATGLPVPEASVEEGGVVLERVAITGLTNQTQVGDLVYCLNEGATFTMTPTPIAKGVGRVKRFWGVAVGDVELFTPNEYLDQ